MSNSGSVDWVKWQIYCETEQAWKYWTLDADAAPPTTCPDDTAHAVNLASVDEVDRRTINEIVVQEESVRTGGRFQSFTIELNADAQATTTYALPAFVNMSALAIDFVTTGDMMGDTLNLFVAPETVVGALTQNVGIGDTVLHVSDSVLAIVAPGAFLIDLTDGVQTQSMGRVRSVDKAAKTLTVESAAVHNFGAATPTYVRFWVQMMRNWTIGPAWEYQIGDSKIGGSFVQQGVVVRCDYTNRSPPLRVGLLTAPVSIGDTVLSVDSSVCQALHYGNKVDLFDGTNSTPLGTVTLVDPSNNQITVSAAATRAYASGEHVRKTAKFFVAQIDILQ